MTPSWEMAAELAQCHNTVRTTTVNSDKNNMFVGKIKFQLKKLINCIIRTMINKDTDTFR